VLETQEGGPLLLHLFDADGRLLAPEPIRATSAGARPIGDGRIASNGNLLYIAWTDRRNGDPDVYGRSFDPRSRAGEAGSRPGEAGSKPGEAGERAGDVGSGAGDSGSRAGEVAARAGNPGARADGPDLQSDRGFGAETRLNSDVASSDQIRPALAAAGARVLVAWQDQRDARSEVFARRRTIPDLLGLADSTDAREPKKTEEPTESKRPEQQKRASDPRSSGASKNAWDEHEFQIPVGRVAPGDPPRSRPAVAMLDSGIALVAWIEGAAGEIGIRAQVLPDSGERPRSDVLVQTLRQEPSRIAVAPLGEREGRRGFLVAFDATGEGEIRSATVGIEGEIASPPAPIGGGAGDLVSDPAVAVLDDGRAIVCWSRRSSDPAALDRAWSIRGRFLAVDGAPTGKEIEFEPSPGGVDWEPAVAPGPDGGFLIAWTAGTRESAVHGREWRDVVARAFDAAANPITPLLRISPDPGEQDHPEIVRLADGSSAVAWEDDISGHDEAHLRRIPKSGRDLGPIVRLDSPSRGCALDHQAPRIAPARSGFAAIWSSSERSKGWDVVLEAFGPRFDSLAPR